QATGVEGDAHGLRGALIELERLASIVVQRVGPRGQQARNLDVHGVSDPVALLIEGGIGDEIGEQELLVEDADGGGRDDLGADLLMGGVGHWWSPLWVICVSAASERCTRQCAGVGAGGRLASGVPGVGAASCVEIRL